MSATIGGVEYRQWPTCVTREISACTHTRTWADTEEMRGAIGEHPEWVDGLGYAKCACHGPDGFPCDESLAAPGAAS